MATIKEQIRQLKLQGYTAAEIAKELAVHPRTVREHLRNQAERSEMARHVELIYEMQMEILTLMRTLAKLDERELRRRMKYLETHTHVFRKSSDLPGVSPFEV